MTREDIIRMMNESCDPDKVPAWQNGFWTITQEELERFAALVAEREREECAKVCDELAELNRGVHTGDSMWQWYECAAAIRARSEK